MVCYRDNSMFPMRCSVNALRTFISRIRPHVCAYRVQRYFANETEGANRNTKRVRVAKRLFSTILFGTTFAAVLYLKKRRKNEETELFKECVMVPRDTNYASNMYFYLYRGYVFPGMLIKSLPQVQKLKARADDILVVSFPKAGTTWVQEIVYLIQNNLDFKAAGAKNLEQRFPFLEYFYPGVSAIENSSSPRLIKTHLPYSLLPESVHLELPKIIYVVRNPKDVCVSLYHFTRYIKETGYTGSFDEFLESFLKGNVAYGPIWKHYLEWWEHRNDANVLIVSYEDLQKDCHSVIFKISQFLDKPLKDDEVQAVAEHCSFERMSQNKAVNYDHWRKLGFVNLEEGPFLRKGQVGDWRNYFTQEMDATMNAWIKDKFGNSGMKFVYQLDSPENENDDVP